MAGRGHQHLLPGPRPAPSRTGHAGYLDRLLNHMLGILVHGDNHFIVRGPLPDCGAALALVRHWSIIQIAAITPPALNGWQIVSREFRENLEWAVVVPGDGEMSPAVITLLAELSARGISLHDFRLGRQ